LQSQQEFREDGVSRLVVLEDRYNVALASASTLSGFAKPCGDTAKRHLFYPAAKGGAVYELKQISGES
jgi:hypothetical protein